MKEIILKCFLCEGDYKHGPHIYEGYRVHYYDFTVCGTCWAFNSDGWNPLHEVKIIEHLKNKNIPLPKKNDREWLPRDIQKKATDLQLAH